jgi:hypothetical protein
LIQPLTGWAKQEERPMRNSTIASLLVVSSLALAFAPGTTTAAETNHPQAVPVKPQLSPRESDRVHNQDRKQASDIRLGRNWRVKQRDRDEHLTVGRDWRVHR